MIYKMRPEASCGAIVQKKRFLVEADEVLPQKNSKKSNRTSRAVASLFLGNMNFGFW